MKVYIFPSGIQNKTLDIIYLLENVKQLTDYNIYFIDNKRDADWCVGNIKDLEYTVIKNPHQRIWLASDQDESSITKIGCEAIKYENVKIFEMKYCVDTLCKQNICAIRYHETILQPNTQHNIIEKLSLQDWNKIRVSLGFYHLPRMECWKDICVNMDNKRDITTFFMGRYRFSLVAPIIEQHRKSFIKLIQQRSNIQCSSLSDMNYTINQCEYNKLLLRTKVIVSPWGLGECCFRDAEAMYAGCILIKPYCDYIQTQPKNIFQDGITYIACNPDGSDLLEKIDYALDNYDNFYDMRCKNREYMLKYFDRNEQAKIIAETFNVDS